ncbi:MAG: LamG-like jellyroll fold domain-containing protein [Bacteroidota bacterium]
MKKILFIAPLLLFLTGGLSYLHFIDDQSDSYRRVSPSSTFKKLDKKTRADLAMEQDYERTKDPKLGYVPRNRLMSAYKYAEKKRSIGSSKNLAEKAITGVSWTERGPSNVGGRTRAIMIDPNDGTNKTVWAAGVSGGLWKTADITEENPDWESIDDFFDNMAISTIAYDPTNTDIMYFGTGEGYFNNGSVEGNGIWKSTDGGDTWTQLASTITSNTATCAGPGGCDFLFVNKIVVTSSGTVLAATRSRYTNFGGGLMRSTDGGTSWTKVLTGNSGTNPCTGNTYISRASDLEIAADDDIFVSFGIFEGQGIWRSQNDGASWTNVYATSTVNCDEQRIELATAPSDANYIYALVQENDNSINKIMRSTNGGGTWNDVGDPTPLWFDQECVTGSNDFTRGQAWYDLIAAVDPNDRDVVYIGGIDLLRTTDGGDNWTQLTNWAGQCDLPEVHADQHAIVYQPGNSDVMYFGNDGGIYSTDDGSSTSPTFKRKEFGYNTSQFYSVAMEPTAFSPEFIGGTQDNGSNKITNLGLSTIVESTGGDGGFAHIDQSDPDVWITAFTNANISRSLDGGLTFSLILGNNGGSFINPTDYDNVENIYYGGFSAGIYFFSTDLTIAGTPGFFSSGTITEMGGGTITHVSASPNTGGVVWFGTNNGRVVRVDDANNTIVPTNITGASFPGGSVSCVAVENGDDNHLLVTFSNYGVTSVWETTDGGINWTSVEGDLPDMPVRWALFNPNNSDEVLIATELGVWSTDNLNGALTEWEPSNDGLANVRTDMLQIRDSDNLVVAATHGRGLFSSDIFTSPNADFTADKNAIYAEKTVNFADASYKATSWEWDFGDGGTSTEQNPSHTYQRSGKYEVTLSINGGAFTAVKSDFVQVMPNLSTPFSAADGGDFESNADYFGSDDLTGGINLWERGTPTNAITNVSSGTNVWKTDLDGDLIQTDYSCALFSPNFNMSAAGTYTLSFRKSMERQFTNAPFGVQVQYSLDNGDNWTRLGTDNDSNGSNWYEYGTDPASVDALETNVIHDRTGFNGNHNNENTTYDISFLSGNATVAFRFVLYVNGGYSGGYNRDGFMIDDFEISGTANEANVNITENSAGSTLAFDGIDDYTTLSDLTINESFTAEFWVSPNSDADGQSFIAKHDATGTDIFKVGYYNGGIEVTVGSETVSGGTKTTNLQHLAVSVERLTGTTSEVTVYRDGSQLYQSTVNDVIGDPSGLSWVLGQDWDGVGVTSDFFDGVIDELKIWNSVRTENEIRQSNFLIPDGLDTNLIGYWQFNENTGTSTKNVITSNEGSMIGTTWTSSPVSVAKGSSSSVAITSATGATTVGGLGVELTGVTGTVDLVVFELDGTPSGTSAGDDYTLTNLVNNPFTIINQFGSGSFTSAELTYTYGPGVFTINDPTRVFLFKRPSTSSGSWGSAFEASSIDNTTGMVTFDGITSFSQTVAGETDAPLPVELVSFNGQMNNSNVDLSWSTASEFQNDYFEVQRSEDGSRWVVVGKVDSKAENGESNELLSYNYTDRNIDQFGTIYYRLRQVDFDGQFEFSDQIVVNNPLNRNLFSLFPNPVKDDIHLQLISQVDQSVDFMIMDLSGKEFLSEIGRSMNRGANQFDFDVSQLKQGIYLLTVRYSEEQQVLRFVVDR